MKPPPPPIVSMRYLVPGARVLNPHSIPAGLVISTNSIGADFFWAVCPGSSLANGQITQSVEMSEAIRIRIIALTWRKTDLDGRIKFRFICKVFTWLQG